MMLSFRVVSLALGSLLVAPTLAMGQDAPQSVRQVEALVARYDSAWNRQDTVTVGRLMAPEYQYFTSLGAVRSRAPMLAFLGSREYVLQAAERSEVVVTVSGPVAVVSTRWKGHGTYQGKRFVDDQRCGLVWVQANDRWQLVSEHCVQIAPDPWAPAE